MIEIRLIQPHEVTQSKHLSYEVAFQIFQDELPLDQGIPVYEARGELADMDDIQTNYFDNGGTFLVMAEGGHIFGTGAIRRLDDNNCALKRLWFRLEYHGRGYGFRMMQELLAESRARGYKKSAYKPMENSSLRQLLFTGKSDFTKFPSMAAILTISRWKWNYKNQKLAGISCQFLYFMEEITLLPSCRVLR